MNERLALVYFVVVAFLWMSFGVVLVVSGNLRDRRLKEQAELEEGQLSYPLIDGVSGTGETSSSDDSEGTPRAGSSGNASKVSLGTQAVKTPVRYGLGRFPVFDDR